MHLFDGKRVRNETRENEMKPFEQRRRRIRRKEKEKQRVKDKENGFMK